MSILDDLSDDVVEIYISNEGIQGILDFQRFKSLIEIDCSDNEITELLNLPNTLIKLNCNKNKITSLDNLPQNLKILDCSKNLITDLNNLPDNLKILLCNNNNIKSLDNLPENLQKLCCNKNNIKSLDNLPMSLQELSCCCNDIKNLDNLPKSLSILEYSDDDENSIILEYLPDTIREINYTNNKIFLINDTVSDIQNEFTKFMKSYDQINAKLKA